MAAAERIDAAVRAGEPDLARRWVEELAGFADATGRPWALATVAYGRAMTADPGDADAESLFVDALAHHARAGRAYDEARTHLAYGEWLRRAQRRVDARHTSGTPWRRSTTCTPTPSTERATAELRASGETARKRDPSTLVRLTPMELKVAQLVASGPVEQGRRRPDLGLAEDRGVPPAQRLRQGGRQLARRARPARPRPEHLPAYPGHLTGVSKPVRDHARQQCTTDCESETVMSVDTHPTDHPDDPPPRPTPRARAGGPHHRRVPGRRRRGRSGPHPGRLRRRHRERHHRLDARRLRARLGAHRDPDRAATRTGRSAGQSSRPPRWAPPASPCWPSPPRTTP